MTTSVATRPTGVVRTKTHQYYFCGRGPWPGVTSITKVLDAPALTHWKMNQVAQAAIAAALAFAIREAVRLDDARERLASTPDSAKVVVMDLKRRNRAA